ncbi:RecB family exonuclease [Williamsia muralis]|uniref:RecB family exonuclease n=1 Tax=Williamsia marianensis TaxID=85044 RepID=A0ABU4EYW8_WILMA|nr:MULTISPECIES: RecB family exonuclease [Williamsia]MDV7135822.1 RecB family exonuclease [Williamsia muralis]PVY32573.1 putative RecB family exonuclease [Williamsia marianensis]
MPTQTGTAAKAVRAPALSPSRAGDYKQCPLLYRYRAIDRLPESPTQAQVKGTVVHAALENLFDMPAGLRVPESAELLVDGAWGALCEETPELRDLVPDDQVDRFLADAHKLISTYYTLENPTAFTPESCELRVEVDLTEDDDDPDRVLLRGFVDRIDVAPDGRVRVVDYKTGRSPGESFESRALFQMKFYALAIYRLRGIVPARLQLLYLADGQSLIYTPEKAELDRFAKTLTAIWKAILKAGATGDFPPKRSRMCQWCDHKAHCPEFGGTLLPYPGWPSSPGETSHAEAVSE